MTRTSVYCLAVVLAALIAPAARADSIIFDTNQPSSPQAGKIYATGTFSGSGVTQVVMYAYPPNGGQGNQMNVSFNTTNNTWMGGIQGLTSGTTYDVLVVMYDTNGNFATATVQVQVQ
jgi:hypothetical protein